jgi:hypothetical protein
MHQMHFEVKSSMKLSVFLVILVLSTATNFQTLDNADAASFKIAQDPTLRLAQLGVSQYSSNPAPRPPTRVPNLRGAS